MHCCPTRRAARARRPVLATLVAALAVLTACSSSSSDGGGPAKSVESGTVAAQGTAPSQALIASGSSGTPIADFSDATYSVPAGFVLAPDGEYAPEIPLEASFKSYYLLPKNDQHGRDLISIIVYTLPSSETVDSATDQRGRVEAYNTKLSATVKGSIDPATIAGLHGYTESASQPPNFHYAAWFAFGAHHLLTLACQISSKAKLSLMSPACGSVLLSMSVS